MVVLKSRWVLRHSSAVMHSQRGGFACCSMLLSFFQLTGFQDSEPAVAVDLRAWRCSGQLVLPPCFLSSSPCNRTSPGQQDRPQAGETKPQPGDSGTGCRSPRRAPQLVAWPSRATVAIKGTNSEAEGNADHCDRAEARMATASRARQATGAQP